MVNEDLSNDVEVNQSVPNDVIYPTLVAFFVDFYPEFKPLAIKESETGFKSILNNFNKVRCLFVEYKSISDDNAKECELTPFFLLTAHYIVISGAGLETTGMQKPDGLISSASVGSVSTSFQQAPYKDNFEYFFNQTSYGQQYLAFLSRKSGIRYVN